MERLLDGLRDSINSVGGVFHPHAYSIGLRKSLRETRLQAYPLPTPVADADLKDFLENIAFIHEFAHFSQYICCSFGLEMARITNICQNILMKPGVDWEFPLMANPDEKFDGEALDRIVAYLFLTTELSPLSHEWNSDNDDIPLPLIFQRLKMPAMYFASEEALQSLDIASLAARTNARAHPDHRLIISNSPGVLTEVIINTGALMEGYAFVTELHHILNAVPESKSSLLEIVSTYPTIYTAALNAYVMINGNINQAVLAELAMIIDLALMYSPHVIHNIGPTHSTLNGGDKYRLPGETFIEACKAAKRVSPILDETPREAQRFQDDVCAAMGIETTARMTELCLERLATIGIRTSSDCAQFLTNDVPINSGRRFALHWLGLDFRRQNPVGFGMNMMRSDHAEQLRERAGPHCSYFDLESRQPIHFLPRQLFETCAHELMMSAFYRSQMSCPLKSGRPFFCDSADADDNTLCMFLDQEGGQPIGECPLDLVEARIRKRPA